jgi:predicted dienelactone hydrolase
MLAILVTGWAVGGCGSGKPLRDPGAAGPYGIGVTERTFTRTSSTTNAPRVLETVIWYPSSGKPSLGPVRDAAPATNAGRYPVVLFSHGASGEPTHASYLTEHLASWGFVVVAPPHPGNTKQDGACNTECLADSFINRLPDVIFTLDQVLALKNEASDPLAGIIDPDRAAMTGFSFGGMTAVRTAPEHRFDAIVGIAPAVPTSLIDIGRQLDVPIFVVSGGEDIAVPAPQVKQFYDALPANVAHYLLYFPKAHHTNFQDICQEACDLASERGHELINRYVTAFLETYLIGNDRYARYLERGEPPDAELTAGGS